MNDTQRIKAILDGFNLRDREAMDSWIESGAEFDSDGGLYDPNLMWTEDGYRVETEEDREAANEKRLAFLKRIDDGTASASERLWYITMQMYRQHWEDDIFNPKPLFFGQMSVSDEEKDDGEVTIR